MPQCLTEEKREEYNTAMWKHVGCIFDLIRLRQNVFNCMQKLKETPKDLSQNYIVRCDYNHYVKGFEHNVKNFSRFRKILLSVQNAITSATPLPTQDYELSEGEILSFGKHLLPSYLRNVMLEHPIDEPIGKINRWYHTVYLRNVYQKSDECKKALDEFFMVGLMTNPLDILPPIPPLAPLAHE